MGSDLWVYSRVPVSVLLIRLINRLCWLLQGFYQCSWDAKQELLHYVTSLPHVSSVCRLSPQQELALLQECEIDHADLLNRMRFLSAVAPPRCHPHSPQPQPAASHHPLPMSPPHVSDAECATGVGRCCKARRLL